MRFPNFLIAVVYTLTFLSTAKKPFKRRPQPSIDEHVARSPFNQHLPNCKKNNETEYIHKKTKAKAIACPMFRDEEGFISEWLAFYKMMGFDHVMMFDDSSIDNSMAELRPWIQSGFVTVKSNWSIDSMNIRGPFLSNAFQKSMAVKAILETECKKEAITWGYEYYLSVDLDEYVIPSALGETFIDELEKWTNSTGRQTYCMGKYNFQSGPHILEPIHLLTIEAFQSRMKTPAKMNYYTSVAPKCAYRFNGPDSTNNSARFIAECCHFHGCQGHDFTHVTNFCHETYKDEAWRVNGKGKPWIEGAVDMFHYSRSVEKYGRKQKTWRTSTGETKAGQTDEQAAKNYDLSGFLHRSVGWTHDSTALRYTCQMRQILQNVTGEAIFLRHGDFWYRNPGK